MFVSTRTYYFVAILAGALFPLAFAPLNLWPLAILCPAALLWTWQDFIVPPIQAFGLGLCFGLGMFGVGVSWVFVSIHHFGHTDVPTAVLITSSLVLTLALFIAFQGFILKRFFQGGSTQLWLLGFPSCWVIFEWIRSWLFTGFPWLYLGYSQINTFLSGYAPVASVYGVSFAVALTSGALVSLLQYGRKPKILATFVIAVVWGAGYLLGSYSFTQLNNKNFTVSLIQGNIQPLDKFTQEKPIESIERTYGLLTHDQWGADLILWPEGAIPLPLPASTVFVEQLKRTARKHHSTLIAGTQVINESGQYYNSLIALGDGKGTYHKYHLVPFGDYVPFEKWLRGATEFFNIPMSSFIPGPKEQELITAGPLKIDPLLCYEIAFPELVRNTLRNADVIITLSEDGWFGNSWGPHQHLQIAQMRALETGRYVLRATTSGITAIINHKGKIVATAPQFEATVLNGTFRSAQGYTPWNETGIWPLLIALFAFFLLPGRGIKWIVRNLNISDS